MPTSYIKKLNRQGKGSVSELEKKWDRAEDLADKQGQGDNYAYRTAIFKSLNHIKSGAVARIKAYAPQPNTQQGQPASKGWQIMADNNYLDSLVESGKFTRKQVDDAWAQAKKTASDEADKNPNIVPSYAYTTAIFQNILGIKQTAMKINAAARLRADKKPDA